jgi:predicted metalloprotease
MRWEGRRESENVHDRRGTTVRGGRGVGGGALGSLVFALFSRGKMKTKMFVIIGVILACVVFQVNPLTLLGLSSGGGSPQMVESDGPAPDPAMKKYLGTMKADNEDVWRMVLADAGVQYRPAKMVIYTGRTVTAGGVADANMGPFYMPADETIYIDPTFFTELEQRFGAKGDFAQAYVVAHEVGHHIQNILGLTEKVHSQRARLSKEEYNKLSVRLELQADFFAGVFAHHGQEKFQFLEEGDIEEAMRCAQAIGDDRIQKQSQGRVQPDLFTHGTSAQRARWFNKGFRTGDISQADTFNIPYPQL